MENCLIFFPYIFTKKWLGKLAFLLKTKHSRHSRRGNDPTEYSFFTTVIETELSKMPRFKDIFESRNH